MLGTLVAPFARFDMLPLRLVVGAVFLVAGGRKLFVTGFSGFAGYLSQLGIEPAIFWSVVVTLVEFLGGIALLIGLLTRWAALLIAIEMVVAILWVKLPKGFAGQGGYQFELTLLAACLTLLLAGPRRFAVDRATRLEY